jgi:hypothetical protein
MLAAVPSDESRTLELFDLALRLVSERGVVSAQLIDHFNKVLRQAKALAEEPNAVREALSPQAIQLACRIREVAELRRAIEPINDITSISPELASTLLTSLEERIAS